MTTITRIWNNCEKQSDDTWIDLDTGVRFGLNQNWTNTDSKNSFFLSDKKNFIYGHRWDIRYILSYYAPFFGNNIICTNEIMLCSNPAISKFKNSKILIVGGGPTASERSWNPDDYDYVFSCNHFYLNDKLKNHNVALATLSPEVVLSEDNKKLHDYLKQKSTIICFEDRFADEQRKYFKFLIDKYPNRIMWAHTRYRGKIGSTARLLCIAIFLGAREIHFIGMDGMSKNTKKGDLHNHAFQKEKRYHQPSMSYGIYRRHYVALWDYIINDLKMHKKIVFKNLGEGHPANQSTDISREMFSMPEQDGK